MFARASAHGVLFGHPDAPGRDGPGSAAPLSGGPAPRRLTNFARQERAPGDPAPATSTRSAPESCHGSLPRSSPCSQHYRQDHRRTAIAGAVAEICWPPPLRPTPPRFRVGPRRPGQGNWNINTGNGFFGGSSSPRPPGGPSAAAFAATANHALVSSRSWWPSGARGPGLGAAGLFPQGRGHGRGRHPAQHPRCPQAAACGARLPGRRWPQGASPSAATSSSAATRSPPSPRLHVAGGCQALLTRTRR